MISASKSTLNLNDLKILRPKVKKNLINLCKKFWEFPPREVAELLSMNGVARYSKMMRGQKVKSVSDFVKCNTGIYSNS